MKKVWLLLCIMVLLLQCACGSELQSTVYDVTYEEKIYTVDQENGTVQFEGGVCNYELTAGSNGVKLCVTYPDGSSYWWFETGTGGHGGWSDDYDPDRYVPGETLWKVLSAGQMTGQDESGGDRSLIGLFLVIVGAFNVFVPRGVWMLKYGWHYKHAEPSDASLAMSRFGGVIAILIGIACFFL